MEKIIKTRSKRFCPPPLMIVNASYLTRPHHMVVEHDDFEIGLLVEEIPKPNLRGRWGEVVKITDRSVWIKPTTHDGEVFLKRKENVRKFSPYWYEDGPIQLNDRVEIFRGRQCGKIVTVTGITPKYYKYVGGFNVTKRVFKSSVRKVNFDALLNRVNGMLVGAFSPFSPGAARRSRSVGGLQEPPSPMHSSRRSPRRSPVRRNSNSTNSISSNDESILLDASGGANGVMSRPVTPESHGRARVLVQRPIHHFFAPRG